MSNTTNSSAGASLNKEQTAVAQYLDGPCCVIAIPGSGKTKTVTEKIGVLVDGHLNKRWGRPRIVMALSFTAAAALELQERASSRLGEDSIKRVETGTFHGIFGNALQRVNASLMTRELAPEKISEDYLVRAIANNLRVEWAKSKVSKRKQIVDCIKTSRSKMYAPGGLQDANFDDGSVLNGEAIRACIEDYKLSMADAQWRDHEMTLEETLKFLTTGGEIERNRNEPERRQRFFESNRYESSWADEFRTFIEFDYLLVDEAQDMDRVQLEIILQLHEKFVTVDIVGDDDQSIYAFRNGLGYAGMQEFIERAEAAEILLQVNYRCKDEILFLANGVISRNSLDRRKGKSLVGNRGRGGYKVTTLDEFEYEESELCSLAVELADQARVGGTERPSTAIIARNKKILTALEGQLTQKGVTYKRVDGGSIWSRPPIVYFINWLNALVDRDVSDDTICTETHEFLKSQRKQISPFDLDAMKREFHLATRKSRFLLNSKAEVADIVEGIYEWFLRAIVVTSNPIDPSDFLIRRLRLAGEVLIGKRAIVDIENRFFHRSIDDLSDEIFELSTGLTGSLAQRLEVINRVKAPSVKSKPKVEVMTIHASKGREFDRVWIIGLSDENLPGAKGIRSDPVEEEKRLEEERRALYVGITRARDEIHLTWSRKRGDSRWAKERRECRFLFILPTGMRPEPYFPPPQYKHPLTV